MKLSEAQKYLIYSSDRGYFADKNGDIISPFDKNLKLRTNQNGYLSFSINFNKKIKTIMVHRLVAYQKFGKRLFKKGTVVRHLDGNPKNNKWENIEIGTISDNQMDRSKDCRVNAAKIAASHVRCLSYKDANNLREDRKNGMKYSELMIKYKIKHKSTVSYIVNNKTYI